MTSLRKRRFRSNPRFTLAIVRAFGAAALLVAATRSAGAQLVFTDRAAFETALGAVQRYYAADVPPNPSTFHAIDAVGVFAVASPTDLWVIPSANSPSNKYATPDGLSTRAAVFGVEPDAPINDFPLTTLQSPFALYAFGMDYGLPQLSPPFVTGDLTFTFSFDNGLSYTRPSIPTGTIADPKKVFEFFGLISVTPFTRITFQSDDTECVGFCARNNASYDAITIAAVPEPGTFALLAGGLAVVGAAARRRRRR